MGAHTGRHGRGLGPGGPGRITRASGLSRRLGARWLPRGRAGERCAFHHRLRACAGAYRWLCAGGSKAGGGNTVARHAVLRPDASASFPSNGRTLTDDAADAFLAVLTNGRVTGDKVGPHIDLLVEFPYLGPPHNISVPSQANSLIATELRAPSGRLGSS